MPRSEVGRVQCAGLGGGCGGGDGGSSLDKCCSTIDVDSNLEVGSMTAVLYILDVEDMSLSFLLSAVALGYALEESEK